MAVCRGSETDMKAGVPTGLSVVLAILSNNDCFSAFYAAPVSNISVFMLTLNICFITVVL